MAHALTVLDDVDLSLDPEAVDLYLTLQYVPAPWSIHKGVRKLPAATTLAGRFTREWVETGTSLRKRMRDASRSSTSSASTAVAMSMVASALGIGSQ